MSIQISGSLTCMTLYFSPIFFTIYCHNVLLLSVSISIAKHMWVYVWYCNPWDCSLSWWPVLTSGFFFTASLWETYFYLLLQLFMLLLWLCHKTGIDTPYRNWILEEFSVCTNNTVQTTNGNRAQTTKASPTWIWEWKKKKVCFSQREKAKWSSTSQSHCVYFTQSITEQRKYTFWEFCFICKIKSNL